MYIHMADMTKTLQTGKNTPREVIAYEADGIRRYGSAREASAHYGLNVQTVYALIRSGKECGDGVSFDWWRGDE